MQRPSKEARLLLRLLQLLQLRNSCAWKTPLFVWWHTGTLSLATVLTSIILQKIGTWEGGPEAISLGCQAAQYIPH